MVSECVLHAVPCTAVLGARLHPKPLHRSAQEGSSAQEC